MQIDDKSIPVDYDRISLGNRLESEDEKKLIKECISVNKSINNMNENVRPNYLMQMNEEQLNNYFHYYPHHNFGYLNKS